MRSTYPNGNTWAAVRERLRDLDALLMPSEVNWVHIAKAFSATAVALHAAIVAEGAQSLRFSAVVKALDLKTSRSALEAFVEADESS